MPAKARLEFKFGLTLTKAYPEEDDFVFMSETQVNCFLSCPILSCVEETEVCSSTKEAKTIAMIYSQTVPFTCNEM